MNKHKLILLAGLALAGANAMAACYTVFDSRDRMLYNGVASPVDLRLQLREGLAARGYPAGSRLVFDAADTCPVVALGELPRPRGSDVAPNTMRLERSARRVARAPAPAPLFTDLETAQSSHLPHVQVAGDIVMVPPAAADRAIRPTVTVLSGAPATMVAGEPDTRTLGAGPAHPAARRQTVITELRDPPMTIVNNGGTVNVVPGR